MYWIVASVIAIELPEIYICSVPCVKIQILRLPLEMQNKLIKDTNKTTLGKLFYL